MNRMKILLLGDASNYHVALAKGLRTLGHDVTVASNGSKWMKTPRDIDLYRHEHMLSGALLYARMSTVLASRLKGYDIVQMVSPGFVDLRPSLLERILRRLRRDNGALYLSALGTDAAFVRNLIGPHPALGFSEWREGNALSPWAKSPEAQLDKWLKKKLQQYNDLFYNTVDGVVSALYEYHKVIEAEYPHVPMVYGGIPVDRDPLPAMRIRPDGEKVKILYAVHRSRVAEKGADKLRPLLDRLVEEMPQDVEIVAPPNMPYLDFIRALADADMVCDQLYSYTPATTGSGTHIGRRGAILRFHRRRHAPACIQPRPARPRRHICAAPGTRCRQSRTASYERRSPRLCGAAQRRRNRSAPLHRLLDKIRVTLPPRERIKTFAAVRVL